MLSPCKLVLQAALAAASLHTISAAAQTPSQLETLVEFGLARTGPARGSVLTEHMQIDTGASLVVLCEEDAANLVAWGLARGTGQSMNYKLADGSHGVSPIIIVGTMTLPGGVTLRNVPTAVAGHDTEGLIGLSFLAQSNKHLSAHRPSSGV